MRDLDLQPYSKDEQRVAEFIFERGTGGGDDPIGSILACYALLAAERNAARLALQMIADTDQYPDHEDTAAELRETARSALRGR